MARKGKIFLPNLFSNWLGDSEKKFILVKVINFISKKMELWI